MIITIVSGNSGKIATCRKYLEPHGIKVNSSNIELIEPQLDDLTKIALSKARQAYEAIGGNIVVNDSGFYVNALNGFPGSYVKHMNATIGNKGLLKLMMGIEDRSCHFEQTIVFVDENKNEHILSAKCLGSLALSEEEFCDGTPWSELWKVFIPKGSSKTLAAMDDEQRHSSCDEARTAYIWEDLAKLCKAKIAA